MAKKTIQGEPTARRGRSGKIRLVPPPSRSQWELSGWMWFTPIGYRSPLPKADDYYSKMIELMGPLGAIRLVGGSHDLIEKISDVEKVIQDAKAIRLFDDPEWEKSISALETLLAQYHHFLDRVLDAEEVLRKNGLRFDEDGKVKFVSSKRELFNRIVVAIYSEYIGNYGEPKSKRDKQGVRKEVKAIFVDLMFPADELDDGPRGNIARAIENYRSP